MRSSGGWRSAPGRKCINKKVSEVLFYPFFEDCYRDTLELQNGVQEKRKVEKNIEEHRLAYNPASW